MTARKSPLELVCGCETTCADENGGYQVLRVAQKGARCHVVGEQITATEAQYIRYVNAEWDRAEAEYLEQS